MAVGILIAVYLIIIATLVIIYIKEQREEEKIPSNAAIADNFMSQYSGGYSQGLVTEIIQGTKRVGYKILPRDRDYYKYFKERKTLVEKPYIVWVPRKKVISIPAGTWSPRNRVILLPPTPEDIPEPLKGTSYGNILMKTIAEINTKMEETDIIRKEISGRDVIINKLGGEEQIRKLITRFDEISDDIVRNANKPSEKRFASSSSVGGYNQASYPGS